MRPKRRVLLIDSNESRAAVTRFTLETHKFAVLSALTLDEARAAYAPDVVLAYYPIDALGAFEVAEAKSIKLIFCCDREQDAPDRLHIIAALLVSRPPCDLIERLKTACARKRGPRKRKGGHWDMSGGKPVYVYPQPAELVAAL